MEPQAAASGMSNDRTTIQISGRLWTELNQRKQPGDTFEDVIRRGLNLDEDTDESETTTKVEPNEIARTDETTTVAIDTDALPGRIDPDDAREVVAAALNVIDAQNGAKFSDIADELLPEHDLGYGDGARNRDGAWWKRVVQPSMKKNGVEHQGGGLWDRE